MTTTLTTQVLAVFQEKPTDNATRREEGRKHMSATMIYWLARNSWSHPAFESLAVWALGGETGAIHTSQVSHMRNGKMRMMGVKVLDAFGAINCAVWAYRNDRALLKQMNINSVPEQIEILIRDAECIMDPLTGLPLDQGGWMNLYLGYLRIPGVVGAAKGDADFEKVAAKVGRYIYQRIQKSGMEFPAAKAAAAKVVGEELAAKMLAVAVGLETMTAEQLTNVFGPLCEGLAAIDGESVSPEAVASALQ